jgi:hypothetical protein
MIKVRTISSVTCVVGNLLIRLSEYGNGSSVSPLHVDRNSVCVAIICILRCEDFVAVNVKVIVFWDVMLCRDQCFRGTCCHLPRKWWQQVSLKHWFLHGVRLQKAIILLYTFFTINTMGFMQWNC